MITITNSDLKKYLGATTNFLVSDMEDAIEVVTSRYILPYLSQAQLSISDTSTDNLHIGLMKVVKRAVINLAYAKDYMKFVLTADVSAVKDISVKETKASKEDKEYHRETFWLEGFASIDEMLQILEENQTTFTQWAGSYAFSQLKNSFVYSTAIYNQFVDINNSRRTFMRLKPAIYQLELYGIPQVINPALKNQLLEKYSTGTTLTPLENQLIELLQGFICNWSMAQTLKKGSIRKDAANTFTVYDDTGLNKTEGRKTPDMSFLNAVQAEYFDTANKFRDTLSRVIAENMVVLGLAPSSDDNGLNFKNDPKRGYFV
jgi:hypothetical protein